MKSLAIAAAILLLLVVPLPITIVAHAQSDPDTLRNRTYGPSDPVPFGNNSTVSGMNSTIISALEDLQRIATLLEPEIRSFNLTRNFNEVVMALANIQGNLTTLAEEDDATTTATTTNNATTNNTTSVGNATVNTTADGAAFNTPMETEAEPEEPEPEPEVVEEEEPAAESEEPEPEVTFETPNVLDQLILDRGGGEEGPRTDPEGDGGFPGDIDG